jgi:muramidase (phage lysozyme)
LPKTQDLIAVELLRSIDVMDKIKSGDIAAAVGPSSIKWAAVPMGPGQGGRHTDQPFVKYDAFLAAYRANGGQGK